MSLITRGFSYPDIDDLENDWQLFVINLDLLHTNKQIIFACIDYFFCSPAFSYCSWPYITGDGPLFLGYLLKCWQSGYLTEHCNNCMGKVLVSIFGGSPLSGDNSWTGQCISCQQKQTGKQSKSFRRWFDFVLQLRRAYPDKVGKIEEYDGFQFSFSSNGLIPVKKKNIVWKSVAENPVTLQVLIDELKAGTTRKSSPVNVCLLNRSLKLKAFNRT